MFIYYWTFSIAVKFPGKKYFTELANTLIPFFEKIVI